MKLTKKEISDFTQNFLEEDKSSYENLKNNIKDFNIENIEILNTRLSEGCVKNSPYDIIIIDYTNSL